MGATPDGYPLPLQGKALTDTPVVVKEEGASLEEYPERFVPHREELGADEMRITCCGSGNPIVRKGQAAASWLVELGNGDKFIFDVGGGSVQNLWSLEIPPAELDKLFLTHLHLDHVGDLHVLFDAMGWARNTPLRIWGPSGYTKEMGTAYLVDCMEKAATWHVESKRGLVPSSGAKMIAHEFDAEERSLVVYEENGVKITSYAAVHCIYGARGYRLDWNGLSMSFAGDGSPSTFEAEQSKGVDVFIHESFMTAEVFSQKVGMPLEQARNVVGEHTTPDRLGQVFGIAAPKLGVGYHYFLNDDTVDLFFEGVGSTYDGPIALAQDLMVISVTPEQIVTRMAETKALHWPPAPEKPDRPPEMASPSEAEIPEWLLDTVIAPLTPGRRA